MISVRCPACGKVIGFDESDGGALVACPHCRQPFFIPAVARTATIEAAPLPPAAAATEPPIVASLPQEPELPDDIAVAVDPDLDSLPEVLPVEEEAPPPAPPEPEPVPPPPQTAQTDFIPRLELDEPPPPEPTEPIGTPTVVKPTDLAASLPAAVVLSEALPPAPPEPERPTDVLEEVHDDREDEKRDERDEEDERRRERRSKKRSSEYPKPLRARSPQGPVLTRNRILGGAGVVVGSLILFMTILLHLTASQSAWHFGVCCGDLFALALAGVGLYFVIRG